MKNISKNINVILLVALLLNIVLAPGYSEACIFQKEEIDLTKFGVGKIIEKDKTIIKRITVVEVHETYIVYEKEGSLHDHEIERIDYIDFPDAPKGAVVVKFDKSGPVVKYYYK